MVIHVGISPSGNMAANNGFLISATVVPVQANTNKIMTT